MKKQYFIQLLDKYLDGKSTVEEDQLLITYYNLFEDEPDVVALLSPEKKEELKKGIYSAIQKNISALEKRPARIRTLQTWMIRSAAAAAAVLIAILTVWYFANQKAAPSFSSRTLAADKKQNRLFHLPDGSMVLLGYGSTLHYAPDFDHAAKREIYLDGQAFFDIHHDASRPFIVHTDKVKTTVLGTAFNVKAVKGEQKITVTVTRGKVKVSDRDSTLDLLIPDQQIVYDRSSGNAVKSRINAGDYLQWKDQEDLMIDNVTFEETAKLLEEKFKVAISFKDPRLKKNQFTTVLLKGENLEHAMKSICEFNGAVWEYNKNKTALLIRKKTNSQ